MILLRLWWEAARIGAGVKRYDFATGGLPEGFFWLNEPSRFYFEGGLNLVCEAKRDFWQRTHYGFQRDDGHCLLIPTMGDFCIRTRAEFELETQYDQCGLMARVDSGNWIKCSVEYENAGLSRLGSVVTNLGYSDWATQDISSELRSVRYQLSRSGNDFLLEHSTDGEGWHQMRVAHLHQAKERMDVGIYACSPLGEGFRCRFGFIEVGDNHWGRG